MQAYFERLLGHRPIDVNRARAYPDAGDIYVTKEVGQRAIVAAADSTHHSGVAPRRPSDLR
jgi:hypothetical protein